MKKMLFILMILFCCISCGNNNTPVESNHNFDITFINNSKYDAIFKIDNKAAAFVDPGHRGTKNAVNIQDDQQFIFINETKDVSVELCDYSREILDCTVALYKKSVYFEDKCNYEIEATNNDLIIRKTIK